MVGGTLQKEIGDLQDPGGSGKCFTREEYLGYRECYSMRHMHTYVYICIKRERYNYSTSKTRIEST